MTNSSTFVRFDSQMACHDDQWHEATVYASGSSSALMRWRPSPCVEGRRSSAGGTGWTGPPAGPKVGTGTSTTSSAWIVRVFLVRSVPRMIPASSGSWILSSHMGVTLWEGHAGGFFDPAR